MPSYFEKTKADEGKIAAPFVRCEYELGERQNDHAFCSVQDNWCSHQKEIWRCPLRKAHASSFQKLVTPTEAK